MLDAVFVLVDWDDCKLFSWFLRLQRHSRVGADDSWLILFQLQIGYVFQKKKKTTPSSTYI